MQRRELLADEAVMASRLLERAGIELVSMREMLKQSTELAIALEHPAYDCIYLAVARQKNARFVTGDQRLLRVVTERASGEYAGLCISLSDVQSSSH